MTPFERLAAAYFAVLLLAAPWAPRRGRGALYAAASLALVIVAAIGLPAPARTWMAHAYLVLGYWVPAAFVASTHPRFERWLAEADVRLGVRHVSDTGRSRVIGRGVLELAYLLCYPLVPAGLILILAKGTDDDVARFWTAVLASGYACYVSLPWAAARPPRLVGEVPDGALPHAFTALNRAVLGIVSHQRVTFPSGHAAVSLVVALEVSRVAPGFGAAFVVIALLVAAAAVVGRYHYFVDVLAGLVVGIVTPLLVHGLAPAPDARDRFFDSDGVRLRYQVSGNGPPVVLIHGFGDTLERWETAGVTRALTSHFRVIALDVRGHGRSDKPRDPQSYGAALRTDVVNVLRHVGAAKAHIVGYSLGALVALDIAAHNQESALSVVLGGAGWIAQDALDQMRVQAGALERESSASRSLEDVRALAALLRGLQLVPENDVRRIRVPVAALIGANDRFFSDVRRLSDALPTVKVVVIPNASHETALDDPAFAAALLTFLKAQSNRPAIPRR